MGINEDYDHDFFFMHTGWRGEYQLVADAIHRRLHFHSVLDLGCGNGYLLERLKARGKRVAGVDGSEHTRSYFPDVRVMDLTQPVDIGTYDLVICTEVAEHLPESAADTLLDSIRRGSSGLVYFSAAVPGFGGHLHLNEQQPHYWVDKFRERHFAVDAERTEAIRGDIRGVSMIWWFKNAYVLRGF